MPDDHSKLVPLLPIPNRTVKRLSADDSADSCVKVGHRQAIKPELAQLIDDRLGFFFWLSNGGNSAGSKPVSANPSQSKFQKSRI